MFLVTQRDMIYKENLLNLYEWITIPAMGLDLTQLVWERVKTTSTVYEYTKYLVYEKVIIE